MRFPLTREFLEQAERFGLRSACCDCLHQAAGGDCTLEWPNQEQRRWPLDAPLPDGRAPTTVSFCKEFELR